MRSSLVDQGDGHAVADEGHGVGGGERYRQRRRKHERGANREERSWETHARP